MNKELTAMQMLIDEMESEFKHATTWSVKKVDIYPWITKAKSLLQKEQEQIEKAFDLGVQSGMTKGYQNVGKDYYQYKYGGEDVDR